MFHKLQGIRISVSYILFLCLFGTSSAVHARPVAAGHTVETPLSVRNATDSAMDRTGADSAMDRLGAGSAMDRTGADADFRVRIMERMAPRTLEISSVRGGLFISSRRSGAHAIEVPSGEMVRIVLKNGNAELRTSSERLSGDYFFIQSESGQAINVRATAGPARPSSRSYTGALDIMAEAASQNLSVINLVPVEAYIASVVGAEYGLNDLEGSKAMAVAARTFALRARNQASQPYHILDDDRDQVYHGIESMTALSIRAANETRGEVLTFDGNLIEALYSASNGGYSANNESIWGGNAMPYLRGKKDKWDQISPDSRWRTEVSRKKLHKALSNRFGISVKDIKFGKTHSDKRMTSVRLVAKKGKDRMVTGSQFRSAVAAAFGVKMLKSTFFKASKKGKNYRFDGHGYGHGVGLSQWGAHGMAKDGKNYRDILNFYYPGTLLKKTGTSVPVGSRLSPPRIAERPQPSSSTDSARSKTASARSTAASARPKASSTSKAASTGQTTTSTSPETGPDTPGGNGVSPWTRRPGSVSSPARNSSGSKTRVSKAPKRRVGW